MSELHRHLDLTDGHVRVHVGGEYWIDHYPVSLVEWDEDKTLRVHCKERTVEFLPGEWDKVRATDGRLGPRLH